MNMIAMVVEGRSANSVETTRAPVGKVDSRYGDEDRGTIKVYRRVARGPLDCGGGPEQLVSGGLALKMCE